MSKTVLLFVFWNDSPFFFSKYIFVDTQFWRHKILEVASDPEYKDYTFAIADEDEFGKFLVDLGLDDSGNEINVGLYDTKKRRYAMDTDDEFSVEGLREFLQDFKDG